MSRASARGPSGLALVLVLFSGREAWAAPPHSAAPVEERAEPSTTTEVPSAEPEDSGETTLAPRVLPGDDEAHAEPAALEESEVRTSIADDAPVETRPAGAEQPERRVRPTRFGPFVLGDERASLQPTYALQLLGELGSYAGAAEARARVRRHRLGFRARLGDDLVVVRLQLNVWLEAVEVLDVFVDVAPLKLLGVRIGQFKIPFTRYRSSSFASLGLADWSIVAPYYGGERQLGLMAHGARGGWGYAAGVFSGENRRASHGLAAPLVYAEPVANPSNLLDPVAARELHPELVMHGFYRSAGMDASRLSDRPGGPLRYALDLSVAWDLRPDPSEDLALRLAPELMLEWRHLSWQLGWYQTWHQRETGDTGLGPWGPLTELGYRMHPMLEVVARYSRVQVPAAMNRDARARADRRIEGAVDAEEDARLRERYTLAGLVAARQELGAAFNVYFVGDSLKLQTDFRWLYSQLREGSPARHDYVGRLQLQVSF